MAYSMLKRFYDRETIDAFNYLIMSFISPFFICIAQIISLILNSRSSANHDKVDGLIAFDKILMKGIVFFCRISFLQNIL